MNLSISELTNDGKKIRKELYAHGEYSWGSLNLRNTFDVWLEDLEQAIKEHPELKKNHPLRGKVKSLRKGLELGGSYRGYDSAMQNILSTLQQFTEAPLAMPPGFEPPARTERKVPQYVTIILKWFIFLGGLSLTSWFLWRWLEWPWLDSRKDKIFLQLAAQLLLIFLFLNIPFRRHLWRWLPLIVAIALTILGFARSG